MRLKISWRSRAKSDSLISSDEANDLLVRSLEFLRFRTVSSGGGGDVKRRCRGAMLCVLRYCGKSSSFFHAFSIGLQ